MSVIYVGLYVNNDCNRNRQLQTSKARKSSAGHQLIHER